MESVWLFLNKIHSASKTKNSFFKILWKLKIYIFLKQIRTPGILSSQSETNPPSCY